MTALRQKEDFVGWENKEKQENEETGEKINIEGDPGSSGQTEASRSRPRIVITRLNHAETTEHANSL